MAFAGIEWILVIVVIVVLLFGAKKIPELARSIGRAKGELTRGQMMVEKEIRDAERAEKERIEREEADRRKAERERAKREKEEAADEEEEEEELTDLQRAAKDLDIDPKGKTDEELRILIKHKMDET